MAHLIGTIIMLVYGVQKPYPPFQKLLVSVAMCKHQCKQLDAFSIFSPWYTHTHLLVAETPECDQGEFLLEKEFLRNYKNMCSFPARASEPTAHEFPVKFMNILDPLRNDNNLGRSVNIGNLFFPTKVEGYFTLLTW